MVCLLQVVVEKSTTDDDGMSTTGQEEKSTTDDDGKSTTGHGGKVYYG